MPTDRLSYNNLWETVLEKNIDRYIKAVPDLYLADTLDAIRENIWNNYSNLNESCKSKYMRDPLGRLDRHKVAACYMIAVLKVSPLREDHTTPDDIVVTINEYLAIEFGLSVLKSFLVTPPEKPSEQDEKDLKIFEKGFQFPTAKNGNYLNNFALELYFTKIESNYNIFSLSHSLYLLEEYNRQLGGSKLTS